MTWYPLHLLQGAVFREVIVGRSKFLHCFFVGIKDLFLLPIEQYQKDGRLIRGLQKGANSFTSSTAMSFLDLTNRVLGVIKFAAEMAFEVMSPEGCIIQGKLPYHASSDPTSSLYIGPTSSNDQNFGRMTSANGRLRRRAHGGRNASNIIKRPSGVREGVFSALAVVQEVIQVMVKPVNVAT